MELLEDVRDEALTSELGKLFVPELLTPEQFFDTLRNEFHDCEGERRMLLEMLMDAIECWQRTAAIGIRGGGYFISMREKLHREAEYWIFGNYINAPYFSFAGTCESLGLDPDFLRRGLLAWRRRRSSEGGLSALRPTGAEHNCIARTSPTPNTSGRIEYAIKQTKATA